MKVVIAGPPHSGKSVFLGGLKNNLPRESYYLFRACPDGEGTWTWRNAEAAAFRRKGQFTEDIVDWYCSRLSRNDLAPIVLVDIGGRTSAENRRILTEGKVEYGIILSGDPQAIPEWETFLRDCGVEVIATIHSDYHGQTDVTEGPVMSVHHLERGEDVSSRPVIIKVAAMLLDMAESEQIKEDVTMTNTIKIQELANKLGKTEIEKTLPNGRVIKTIEWTGSDLPKIDRLLHNAGYGRGDHIKIDGAAPGWLVTAVTHMVHPASVSINSPDGFVPVGASIGDNDNIEITWDGRVLSIRAIDPSKPFSPEDLGHMPLPDIFGAKIMIISGRIPNWMLASIGDYYAHKVGAVACFQPGIGATVAISHTTDVPLGTLIK